MPQHHMREIHKEEDIDESPFEDAIYNFLVNNGYTVHKKIGCAGFRVDLAIVKNVEGVSSYIMEKVNALIAGLIILQCIR